jgi:xanthine dehydrogenase accessory factor
MKEILTEVDRWQRDAERVALATVVRVRGSAPRPPGARLWVTRSGKIAGSVSGGCVESDVVGRAREVIDSGRPVMATYGIADDVGLQVGLSCGGSIDVLIQPFAEEGPWRTIREALAGRRPAALAVGLTPERLVGRMLAVLGDGSVGSIDAQVDGAAAVHARALLAQGGTRLVSVPLAAEEATVFVEAFPPEPRLVVIGATHTAIALSRMARQLGFRVTVIDARSAFATPERFPDVDELVHGWPDEALERAELDGHTFVVILTHDPKFDIPALTRALRSDVRYVGIIGSRGTHERRRERLLAAGFASADLDRIRAPIGLDIGARTPEEVALAILAEVLAVRSGRDGRPLRERQASIHGEG